MSTKSNISAQTISTKSGTTTLSNTTNFTIAKSNTKDLKSFPYAYSGWSSTNLYLRSFYITSVSDTKTTSYPLELISDYTLSRTPNIGSYASLYKTMISKSGVTSTSFRTNRAFTTTGDDTSYGGTFTSYTLHYEDNRIISTSTYSSATTYVTFDQTTTVLASASGTQTTTSSSYTFCFRSTDSVVIYNNQTYESKKASSDKTYTMSSIVASITYTYDTGGALTDAYTSGLSLRTLLSESVMSEGYATRSSTYSTEYLTCSSTFGYSGISSSQSSGWS